jgi:hypothetical protein
MEALYIILAIIAALIVILVLAGLRDILRYRRIRNM